MRFLLGVALALLPLPSAALAQSAGDGESVVERWHPEAFEQPSSGEPALQLELQDEDLNVVPTAAARSSLDEAERRVGRARVGLVVSSLALGAGVGAGLGAAAGSICISFGQPCETPRWVAGVAVLSVVLSVGGLVGIVMSSVALRRNKRERDELRQAYLDGRRRVYWDAPTARFVF